MRACLLLLVASFAALAAADTIFLTVLYCPTLFSSKGATVSVDPATGNWSIVGTFDWGKELGPGCLIEGSAAFYDQSHLLAEDPTVYFDTPNSKLYLDFLDDFDRVLVLDVTTAQYGPPHALL